MDVDGWIVFSNISIFNAWLILTFSRSSSIIFESTLFALQAESNLNDLVSEYQQYQDASAEEEAGEFGSSRGTIFYSLLCPHQLTSLLLVFLARPRIR